MTNFWDLPKPVREKIYRLHFRYTTPLKYETFKRLSWSTKKDHGLAKDDPNYARIMPSLLRTSYRVEIEASPIFFGENTILVTLSVSLSRWFARLWPRHAKQIRKIALEWVPRAQNHDWEERRDMRTFATIRSLPLLESLVITVDEQKILRKMFQDPDVPVKWHGSLGAGPQIYVHMMRATGMSGLLSLRNLQHVEFLLPQSSGPRQNCVIRGSIPGGFLETVVRPQIMQPDHNKEPEKDREGHFRFLDLPAEMRNNIYDILLVIPGTTFPVPDSLTISASRKRIAPKSVLNILGVNRQINREAYAHFYSRNHLAFATPVALQTFLFNLGHARLDCLRNVTFFYQQKRDVYHHRDGLTPMDMILSMLRSVRGLQKLHIVLQGPYEVHLSPGRIHHLPCINPPLIPGVEALFSFRNPAELKVHSPYRARDYREDGVEVVRAIKQVEAAFKHFNHGLRLTQSGRRFTELYANENWDRMEEWPAVGTRLCECGPEQGCVCAPDSDDDE